MVKLMVLVMVIGRDNIASLVKVKVRVDGGAKLMNGAVS